MVFATNATIAQDQSRAVGRVLAGHVAREAKPRPRTTFREADGTETRLSRFPGWRPPNCTRRYADERGPNNSEGAPRQWPSPRNNPANAVTAEFERTHADKICRPASRAQQATYSEDAETKAQRDSPGGGPPFPGEPAKGE